MQDVKAYAGYPVKLTDDGQFVVCDPDTGDELQRKESYAQVRAYVDGRYKREGAEKPKLLNLSVVFPDGQKGVLTRFHAGTGNPLVDGKQVSYTPLLPDCPEVVALIEKRNELQREEQKINVLLNRANLPQRSYRTKAMSETEFLAAYDRIVAEAKAGTLFDPEGLNL